jgi:hypothetical protein
MNESNFFKSLLYQHLLAERDEILKYKWVESEKVGYDIGFDKALIEWTAKHKSKWFNYVVKHKYFM